MAGVAFSQIWLNLASDPTVSVSLDFVTEIGGGPQNQGEDRQYGQRIRGVDTGVTAQQRAVTAEAVEPDDLEVLLSLAGRTQCYRDPTGTKFYGTFRSPSVTWHQYDDDADVSFTFTEQSYSETTAA